MIRFVKSANSSLSQFAVDKRWPFWLLTCLHIIVTPLHNILLLGAVRLRSTPLPPKKSWVHALHCCFAGAPRTLATPLEHSASTWLHAPSPCTHLDWVSGSHFSESLRRDAMLRKPAATVTWLYTPVVHSASAIGGLFRHHHTSIARVPRERSK